MRTFLSLIMIALLSFGLVVNEAAAKGFGGGRAIGFHRSTSSFNYKATPKESISKRFSNSRWRSGLTGFLMGGLLASLFFGHGFGSGLFSWLILGGLIFIIINLVRRSQEEKARRRDWH